MNKYWPEFFIQETILEILRIKHKIDRKPIRHLAANIAFLQSLRSYSFSAENEWFKVSLNINRVSNSTLYSAEYNQIEKL